MTVVSVSRVTTSRMPAILSSSKRSAGRALRLGEARRSQNSESTESCANDAPKLYYAQGMQRDAVYCAVERLGILHSLGLTG